ncbi:MAG: hypothetical protein PHW29_04460 [Flavobacterium sp.]|nr:hypothetical protein [Flavobacterium sp.]
METIYEEQSKNLHKFYIFEKQLEFSIQDVLNAYACSLYGVYEPKEVEEATTKLGAEIFKQQMASYLAQHQLHQDKEFFKNLARFNNYSKRYGTVFELVEPDEEISKELADSNHRTPTRPYLVMVDTNPLPKVKKWLKTADNSHMV